jgi:hypothetical protein
VRRAGVDQKSVAGLDQATSTVVEIEREGPLEYISTMAATARIGIMKARLEN